MFILIITLLKPIIYWPLPFAHVKLIFWQMNIESSSKSKTSGKYGDYMSYKPRQDKRYNSSIRMK